MADDAKPWVTADGVRVGPGDVVWDWDGTAAIPVRLTHDGFLKATIGLEWWTLNVKPTEIIEDWYSTSTAAIGGAIAIYRRQLNEASDGIRRATNALAKLDA